MSLHGSNCLVGLVHFNPLCIDICQILPHKDESANKHCKNLVDDKMKPNTGDETISSNPWEQSPHNLPHDISNKAPANKEASKASSPIINRINLTTQPELLARLSLKTIENPSDQSNTI
ncbi:hypothetical protein PGT21_026912 [Puccinia graminis f. sp. tritici]|uniref:Uncharacterized protein n=2 Tax=Puccinia graminis f. sp. tritici TaxID=56615 RepID=H6QP69_PUCGT|nr:uncharacterized protein PGTG_20738 [Puccinia graminis f. sp. tritici CRL 75-36-700-3]EHS63154.1 hypothetical protein PGTG_20738 [Puccinia graminis f. sp. tritici CRL 75-36-700-3]KAA1117901.1 hypothetical protein PGT21_026912 [Puccinia graminis f. sp. tritici]